MKNIWGRRRREIGVVITTKESGQEDQNANGNYDVEEVICG
jgi:hypothetical protein